MSVENPIIILAARQGCLSSVLNNCLINPRTERHRVCNVWLENIHVKISVGLNYHVNLHRLLVKSRKLSFSLFTGHTWCAWLHYFLHESHVHRASHFWPVEVLWGLRLLCSVDICVIAWSRSYGQLSQVCRRHRCGYWNLTVPSHCNLSIYRGPQHKLIVFKSWA